MRIRLLRNVVLADGPVRRWLRAGKVFEWPDAGAQALIADGAAEAMEPLPAPEVSAETVDVGTPITDEEAAALPDAEIEVVESASSDSTAGAQEDEPPAPKKGRKG